MIAHPAPSHQNRFTLAFGEVPGLSKERPAFPRPQALAVSVRGPLDG